MVRVNRKALAARLALARKATARCHGLPIISETVRLATYGDGLYLEATDLELYASARVLQAAGNLPARVVDAKRLAKILRGASGCELVTLRADARGVVVEWDGGQAPVPSAGPAEEWPTAPAFDSDGFASLELAEARALFAAGYAMSADETRYNLHGAFLERVEGHRLRLVATDGHRLHIGEPPVAYGWGPGAPGAIVPARAVSLLAGELAKRRAPWERVILAADAPAPDKGTGPRIVRAVLEDHGPHGPVQIIARAIEGDYPNYRQVIPAGGRPALRVSAEALAEACSGILPATPETTRAVKVCVEGRDVLRLEAAHPDADVPARVDVPAKADLRLVGAVWGMNAGYLRDAARALGGTLRIQPAEDPNLGPVRLEADADGVPGVAIIMPVRL